MAGTTIWTHYLPLVSTIGGLAVLLAVPWLVRIHRLAIGFLWLSLLTGQMVRLPLPGQGGGLLLSDLAVVVVLLSVGWRLWWPGAVTTDDKKEPSRLLVLVTPFILWSAFTLMVRVGSLSPVHLLIAAAYWLRLTTSLLLLPALTFLFNGAAIRQYAWRGLFVTIFLLASLGIAQLILAPDLSGLALSGWDPHQGRLVGTWLDPNFMGAFFILGLIVTLFGWGLGWRQRTTLALLVGLCLLATHSRGTVISLALTLLITAPLSWFMFKSVVPVKHRLVWLNLSGLVVTLTVLAVIALLPRLVGLAMPDATVLTRWSNIKAALSIARDNVWLGVGYNVYQFAAREAGLISNFGVHSRAGTDNSWLTLWATTGLIGLVLFILPWMYVVLKLVFYLSRYKRMACLAGIMSVVALSIHAQFINSFLYAHLLIMLIAVVALALDEASHPLAG